MNKQLKQIADHYGKDAQVVQAVEELNELACAMLQYKKRNDCESFEKVVEEVTDVEIMLEQMKYLYRISDDFIGTIKQGKIKRQLGRIESEVTNE